MTILQISDTHNRHRLLTNLPTADVLVHCGDFTDMGTEEEGAKGKGRGVGGPANTRVRVRFLFTYSFVHLFIISSAYTELTSFIFQFRLDSSSI